MSAKIVLVFCAQALFVQLALGACAGRPNLGVTPGLGASGCAGPVLSTPVLPSCGCSGLGYNGIGYGNTGIGYGAGAGCRGLAIDVIPTSGGSLPVYSSSPISPTGLTLVSDNEFEGCLHVCGELPFASAVALEGVIPSSGASAISYSCGNGVTAIESIAPSAAYGTGIGAYGAGIGTYGAAAGVAPWILLPGCSCPVADIVAPSDGCYPCGIYY